MVSLLKWKLAFLALTGLELANVVGQLEEGTKAIAEIEEEFFCPTCEACGIDGCCPADSCLKVRCKFGEGYIADIRDREQMLEDEEARLGTVVVNIKGRLVPADEI
jgi:hypothetical protein